ncbi:MAG: UDP-N-acetylmuramoyl-tripeptide--D-alanyl-D-alanine ligase [Aquificaceae bacterium]
MRASEVAHIVKGRLIGQDVAFKGFCIDSREVKGGEVFVAIKGQRHDGHSFIHEAFQRGASGALSQRLMEVPKGKFLVLVKDTLEALRGIALFKRDKFKGRVIGVVGSAGKTTTKELIYFLLSSMGKICRTPKNYNSQIGVPLSLANFDEDCLFWVVEMGAGKRGDIKNLTRIVKPNVGVITAIGEEHLETFGCLDDVISGNGEIFHDFDNKGWAVIPDYVSHCYDVKSKVTFGKSGDVKAESLRIWEYGMEFSVDGTKVFMKAPSLGLLENALCSIGVLKALGYDWREFLERFENFKPVSGRFRVIKEENLTILDDTYNANPPSVKKALETLSLFDGYKVALLGDMLELGHASEKYHRDIGKLCAELNIDECIFHGKDMLYAFEECNIRKKECYFFRTKEEIIEHLMRVRKQKSFVLVKGSRGMRMEDIVESLLTIYKKIVI